MDGAVAVDIELESTSTTVSVTGVVLFESSAECRRCLRGVSDSHRIEVREVFEEHWTEGETYALIPHAAGTMIDLEPMVREAVLLTLPLAPLCGPSCVGPDPDRFPTGPASDPAPVRDPRWAALDELDLN